jgi:hypothetical protein
MCCAATSCVDIIGGAQIGDAYFIYVTGDVGRSVQISYLGREILNTPTNDLPATPPPDARPEDDEGYVFVNYGNKNVYFTENVKLPFSKDVAYIRGINVDDDVYVTIVSENDSTTRAIIFGTELLLADSVCGAYNVWRTGYAQGECSYCKDLSKDSVMNYLRDIRYPCYLEFSKGETAKKVRLRDYWE